MRPYPHGFSNENSRGLCRDGQKIGFFPPNKDILPETKEELKEFTKNLAQTKNKKPKRR